VVPRQQEEEEQQGGRLILELQLQQGMYMFRKLFENLFEFEMEHRNIQVP
jgi:hypothetical protein